MTPKRDTKEFVDILIDHLQVKSIAHASIELDRRGIPIGQNTLYNLSRNRRSINRELADKFLALGIRRAILSRYTDVPMKILSRWFDRFDDFSCSSENRYTFRSNVSELYEHMGEEDTMVYVSKNLQPAEFMTAYQDLPRAMAAAIKRGAKFKFLMSAGNIFDDAKSGIAILKSQLIHELKDENFSTKLDNIISLAPLDDVVSDSPIQRCFAEDMKYIFYRTASTVSTDYEYYSSIGFYMKRPSDDVSLQYHVPWDNQKAKDLFRLLRWKNCEQAEKPRNMTKVFS